MDLPVSKRTCCFLSRPALKQLTTPKEQRTNLFQLFDSFHYWCTAAMNGRGVEGAALPCYWLNRITKHGGTSLLKTHAHLILVNLFTVQVLLIHLIYHSRFLFFFKCRRPVLSLANPTTPTNAAEEKKSQYMNPRFVVMRILVAVAIITRNLAFYCRVEYHTQPASPCISPSPRPLLQSGQTTSLSF